MAVTKTILKRTNLRAYPTKAQELVLSQSFGNSRFIWNYYVSIFLNKDLTTKIYPTVKELKEKYGFDLNHLLRKTEPARQQKGWSLSPQQSE
jgi:hypothetical protein